MATPEENMERVKQLMAEADRINMGEKLQAGVRVDFKSEEGNTYSGVFVFKRASMLDYMRMGAIKSEILREAGVQDIKLVDNSVKLMANIIATFKVCVVKCPEWFLSIESITEPEVLYHVYGKFEEWQDSFRKVNDDSNTDGGSETT